MEIQAVCAVLTLVSAVFYALIIKPLSQAINELKELVSDIRRDLKEENDKRANVEIRLSVVEEKIDMHLKKQKD
jgi:type II secretory pathway component PulM